MSIIDAIAVRARHHRANIRETAHQKRYDRQLSAFAAQPIDDCLVEAGADVLAWEMSTRDLDELDDREQHELRQTSRRVLTAMVPHLRATYGMRAPGNLPHIDDVLTRFEHIVAAAVPEYTDEDDPQSIGIGVRERTYRANVLLRNTLPEILIDLPEL